MDFGLIHNAILSANDLPFTFKKNIQFYQYLLNNRVAYYYVSKISKNSNSIEKKILESGVKRNLIFYRTLSELDYICGKYNINFMLYKTYKYYGEIVGGDIDIIVKKSDFHLLLNVLSKYGWECIEDEPGKGKCTKNGYIVIEPHISISWNGNVLFDDEKIWDFQTSVLIHGKRYSSLSITIEKLSIILKILYEPEYLDLYDYLILHKDSDNFNQYLTDQEKKYYQLLMSAPLNIKYPFFLSSWSIFYINFIRFLTQGYCNKRMFIHNLYWKIRYNFFGKLPYLTSYIILGKKR